MSSSTQCVPIRRLPLPLNSSTRSPSAVKLVLVFDPTPGREPPTLFRFRLGRGLSGSTQLGSVSSWCVLWVAADSPVPTTGWSRRECHDSWDEDEEDADDDADEGEKVVVEVAEDVVFSVVLTNGSDGGDRRGLRVLSPNVLGDVRARGARISSPRSAASSDMSATSSQDWFCDIFRGMRSLTGGGGGMRAGN